MTCVVIKNSSTYVQEGGVPAYSVDYSYEYIKTCRNQKYHIIHHAYNTRPVLLSVHALLLCVLSVGGSENIFSYAYCHGFLSGPESVKGQALREILLKKGVDLSLLNLNGEDKDPGAITFSGAVKAVRAFHLDQKSALGKPDLKLRLAGSSLGGYVVARWAANDVLIGLVGMQRGKKFLAHIEPS